MKILLKLSIIFLAIFLSVGTLKAQCNITMSVSKISETSTTVRYAVQATTTGEAGRIVINGIKTCRNANTCWGHKTVSKSCYQQSYNFKCSVKRQTCIHADGCIVVIDPLSGC